MEGTERRSPDSKRIDVVRPVAVFAEGKEGILRGKTLNISTSGCSISLDDMLEIGEKVLFRIDLGEGFDPAIQSAKVVWADGDRGRVGVSFTGQQSSGAPALPGDEGERDVLPAAGSVVKLSIEKMEKPLRVICQEAGSRALTLKTSIPFLETRKNVTVHFKDESGQGREVEGVLTDVSLDREDGEDVPTINLLVRRDLDLQRPAAPPPRPESPRAAEPGRRQARAPELPPQGEGMSAESVEERRERDLGAPAPKEPSEEERERTEPPARIAASGDEDGITPRYVEAVRLVIAWLIAAAGLVMEKLGPAVRKMIPAARRTSAAALRGGMAAAGAIRSEAGGLLRRGKKQRRTAARKTRLTMRRQTPRRKTMLAAILSMKWQVLLLLVTLLAASAGVWGLVKIFKANNEELPEPSAEMLPAVGDPGAGSARAAGSYDLWGAGSEAKVSSVNVQRATVVAAAPAPEEDKAESPEEEGAAETADGEAPQPSEIEETEIVDRPIWVNGTVRLYVKGEIHGFKHYPLAEPPGLVVDVKGAEPLLEEGLTEVKGSKVRHLKTLKRDDGTRFILIFNGSSIPTFELIAHSDRIEVKL